MGGRIGPPGVLAACAAEGFTTSNAQLSDHFGVERVHVPKPDLGAEPQCSSGGGGGGGSAAGPDSPEALRCSVRQLSRRLSVAELVQQSEVRGTSRPAAAKLFHRAAALHGFLARVQPGEIEGGALGALDQRRADDVGEKAFDPASLPLFRDAPAAVQAEVATALQVLADQPALLGNLTDGEIEPSEAQLLKAVSAALEGARHGWRKDARRRWRAARLAVGLACGTTQPSQLQSSPPSGTPSVAGGGGRNGWVGLIGTLPELSPPPPQLPPPNVWARLGKPARKYASVSPEGGGEAQGRPPTAEEPLPERMRHDVSCVPARPSSQPVATPASPPTPQQLPTRRGDEGVRAEPDWDALGAAAAARDPESAEQALSLMRQLSPTCHRTSPGTPIVPAALPSGEEASTPNAGPAEAPEARRGFHSRAPRLHQSEAEALFARLSSPLAASSASSAEASVSAAAEPMVPAGCKPSALSRCAGTSCSAAATPPASKRESPATRASPLGCAAGSSAASGGSSPPKPSAQAGRKPRYMLSKDDRMAFYKCANAPEGCGCHSLRDPPGA